MNFDPLQPIQPCSIDIALGSASLTEFLRLMEEQDKQFLDALFDGKGRMTLSLGDRKVTLVPENQTSIDLSLYDQEDIYPNCTVQVLTNTAAGVRTGGGGGEMTDIDREWLPGEENKV